jgi:riboflavin transporter
MFSIVAANMSVYLLISGLLNTVWLTHLLGTGFLVLLFARLISHGLIALVNTILVYALAKSFQKSHLIPDSIMH